MTIIPSIKKQKLSNIAVLKNPILSSDSFITLWDMPVGEFRLRLYPGATYNCTVNFGDGTPDVTVTHSGDTNQIHDYTVAGRYIIVITGIFTRHFANYRIYCDQLIKVLNWGDVGFTSMVDAFSGCSNLTSVPNKAITGADTVTDCTNMFEDTVLTSIPDILFDNMPLVADYTRCFCNIGGGLIGNAPELWNLIPAPIGLACFWNDTNLTNYSSIPAGWK